MFLNEYDVIVGAGHAGSEAAAAAANLGSKLYTMSLILPRCHATQRYGIAKDKLCD
jgi:tRNA U34 5-carboxymethylaminomethyl modifying enzyme MnmG/GidA